MPYGRILRPEDVAGMATFLLSDAAYDRVDGLRDLHRVLVAAQRPEVVPVGVGGFVGIALVSMLVVAVAVNTLRGLLLIG